MLYERKDLPELHHIKHMYDDVDGEYVKYDEKILNNTLSPYMYENDLMNQWLTKMQPLVALMFDQMNIMKNFQNYMVDKFEYRQR